MKYAGNDASGSKTHVSNTKSSQMEHASTTIKKLKILKYKNNSSMMKEEWTSLSWQLVCGMVWHHFRHMEVVGDLFHASFGVRRKVDEDFTSL